MSSPKVVNPYHCLFLSKVSDSQKNITSHKEQLDEHSDRIYAMSEHLRNVQQELQHTQVSRNEILSCYNCKLHINMTIIIPFLEQYFASFEQDLLNARKREIETENHMKQIGMYSGVF